MPDEDLLLNVPNPEYGAGVIGVCDICHKRQAVIVLEKERYRLCVMDFLNKSWIKSAQKPGAEKPPFTTFTEFVNTSTVPGGVVPSIRIKPNKAIRHPLILIMPDPIGLSVQAIEAGIRFARAGYEVAMPDAGRIHGLGFAFVYLLTRGMRVMTGSVYLPTAKRAKLFRVMDAVRRVALEDGMVDASRQVVFGAGYGGSLALAYAAETNGLKAVALAYPYAVSPHGRLTTIDIPIHAVFGDMDHTVGHSCDVLKRLSEHWNLKFELSVVKGGGHHFLSRDRRDFTPKVAEDGWNSILGFLRSILEPPLPPPTLNSAPPLMAPIPAPQSSV